MNLNKHFFMRELADTFLYLEYQGLHVEFEMLMGCRGRDAHQIVEIIIRKETEIEIRI